MDEKRFVSEDDCCGYYTEIIDNEKELNLSLYNPKKNLTIEELVGLMNDLNDENIELHIQNDFLKDENQHMRNLVNENKQLKQKVDFYKYFQKDARELENENEELKSTIKEVTELLSDEVDLFSDRATEHDIIAYVELKELDNKDAFYMATATKKAIQILKELLE